MQDAGRAQAGRIGELRTERGQTACCSMTGGGGGLDGSHVEARLQRAAGLQSVGEGRLLARGQREL